MQKSHDQNRNLSNAEQYDQARALARRKRDELGIKTTDIKIPLLKKICKDEGVKVDLVENIGARIRAAYFFDDDGASILLKKDLPREPKLFALAHELKHHFLDRNDIADGKMRCGDYNANNVTEIAAEEFAAEFIYPILEMQALINSMEVSTGNCTPQQIVEIKRRVPAPVSYLFVRKRLERFGIIPKDQFSDVKFQKLEEQMYPPLYKQDWFKRVRARKRLLRKQS